MDFLSLMAEFACNLEVSEEGFQLGVQSEIIRNALHLFRAPVLLNYCFAQGSESAEVAPKEGELKLQLEPASVVSGNFARKPLHGCRIVIEIGDPIPHLPLKWRQGSSAAPFIDQLFRLVEPVQN